MYNVMLVDDDYPVLELLSEVIEWEKLDLRLESLHENGLAAWQHAQERMPDILITDIGMPKMDGLELIRRLKERKPNLRVAILSCLSEFQYAQQAVKLNVQDYLLKDALEPIDLEKLLRQFKEHLDEERQLDGKELQLRHLVEGTKDLRKEKFIRNTIHQPLLSTQNWLAEAASFGLELEGMACLPALGSIDKYRSAKQRFLSDETLRFAVDNVVEETIRSLGSPAVHFSYGPKEIFVLFPFRPDLKRNIFDEAGDVLRAVQNALLKTLKISMSFILGGICPQPEALKPQLNGLIASYAQRFYMQERSIAKMRTYASGEQDLFSYYDQASSEFRELIVGKKADAVAPAVERWIAFLREREFAPEIVKDWALKLMLDLKLKLQSLQYFRSAYSADVLHKEMVEIDSLAQLKDWLTDRLQSAIAVAVEVMGQSARSEVREACDYVSRNLDKRISLEEVADKLYLNPSYFSRLFKKETGETFIEYVTRMKIQRAKELLDQTDHSVGKICEMLGYDNQSYFIKLFKSHTGVTPLEYRGK